MGQKPKQSTKDRMDSRRAAQVFRKFDQDHNNKVSLCEYENAMYRTEMLEKRMSAKKTPLLFTAKSKCTAARLLSPDCYTALTSKVFSCAFFNCTCHLLRVISFEYPSCGR